jgi:Flp pilus assembly protein TadD
MTSGKKPRRRFGPPALVKKPNTVSGPDGVIPIVPFWLVKRLEDIRKVIVSLATIGLVLILGSTLIRVLSSNELMIDPVSLPKNIKELGYSEDATAMQLANHMQRIMTEANSEQAAFRFKTSFEEQAISVPVAGLSFDSAVRLLRQSLGWPQRRLMADMVCLSEPCTTSTVQMRLRITGDEAGVKMLGVPAGGTPDAVIEKAAEAVLGVQDPLALATYFYGPNSTGILRRAESSAIAQSMIAANHPQRKWAYNLVGLELFDRPTKLPDDIAQSTAYFEAATVADPRFALPYINWGAALSALGDKEGAIEKYKVALTLTPDEPLLHHNYGIALGQIGKHAEALAELIRAKELNPNDADTLNALGGEFRNSGKLEEAIATLKDAIAMKPDFAFAQFNIGLAYKDKGDKPEAIKAFAEYLRLIPDAEDKATVDAWLAALRQ